MRAANKKWQKVSLALSFSLFLISANAAQVGYWAFEETSGTAIYDSSGYGNNGTLINGNAGTHVSGVFGGNALYFPGITGINSIRVEIPDNSSLDLTGAASFTAWVKTTNAYRDAPILAKEGPCAGSACNLAYWFGVYYNRFGMLLDTNNFYPWNADARWSGSILNNQWTFLASTWDGTAIRHYLNGALIDTISFGAGSLYNSSSKLTIGVNSDFNFTAFHGIIDEVRLFNHALTTDEISSLYRNNALPSGSIPEPGSLALVGSALALIVGMRRWST